jgi:hypothetical protein
MTEQDLRCIKARLDAASWQAIGGPYTINGVSFIGVLLDPEVDRGRLDREVAAAPVKELLNNVRRDMLSMLHELARLKGIQI